MACKSFRAGLTLGAAILVAAIASDLFGADFASGEEARTLYIAPSPAGSSDGSSWSNAGPLEKLSTFIEEAGPGGRVLLKAGDGPFRPKQPVMIKAGGRRGVPVTVSGADENGMPKIVEIVGVRADPWRLGGHQGSEVIRLNSGADHLQFTHISFRNQGNGCFRIAADIRDLEIADIEARNVRRFVENYPSGEGQSASVDGLKIRRVTVRGYSKGAIRLQGNSRNIVVEDVFADSEHQDGDNFAIGISLAGTVHDVVLRRVTMLNNYDSTHEYWNGDGFATERGVYNVHFEDTLAAGSTDGGYDLKSSATTLLRARAEDNMRNFRIWGESTVTDCVSRNPHKRGGNGSQNHFWIAAGGRLHIDGCLIDDSDSATIAFEIANKGEVIVRGSTIRIDTSARLSAVADGGLIDIDAK